VNAFTCTSEVVFELGDTSFSTSIQSMDAFELDYDFVHVRAFTYILS